MSSENIGKMRQKRNQTENKPYSRNTSLIRRFSSSVKDFLMPSWLAGGSGDVKDEKPTCSNQQVPPSTNSVSRSQTAQFSGANSTPIAVSYGQMTATTGVHNMQSSTHNYEYGNKDSQFSKPATVNRSPSNYFAAAAAQHLTSDESTRLRMSDSYVNDNNSTVQSASKPVLVSTGSLERSSQASKKQKLWSPEVVRQGRPFVPPATEKPSFNSVLFGGLDKSDASMLGGSFRESSFYAGKTRYGGASADRRQSLNKSLPYQSSLPLRKQVKANKMNTSYQAVTSTTAQRILDTLDKMSTPLGDAKKIPSTADASNDSILSFTPSSYRRTSFLGSSRAATRPLQLPKGPPTNNYQTTSRAEIGSNRYRPSEPSKKFNSSTLPTDDPKDSSLVNEQRSTVQHRSTVLMTQEAPVLLCDEQNKASSSGCLAPPPQSSGKMKTKKFSKHEESFNARTANQFVPEVPSLRTEFTLPVSAINNPISLASSTKSQSASQASIPYTSLHSDVSPLKFTFSTPIQKTQASHHPLNLSEKDYTFSSPIQASSSKACAAGAEEGAKSSPEPAVGASSASVIGASATAFTPTSNKAWGSTAAKPKKTISPDIGGTSSSFKSYNKWENTPANTDNSAASESQTLGFSPAPATSLKQGSVMDILGRGNKSFSSPAAAPISAAPSLSKNDDLMAKFKKPAGAWECDICMIQNKADVLKCVACEAPKPAPKKTGPSTSKEISAPPPPASVNTPSISNDLIAKFKKAEGTWECDICMLSNKPDATKCVACEAPNPKPNPAQANVTQNNNSLSAMFKKPSGNWECDTCMVQNTASALKCIACESTKPGLQSAGVVSKPTNGTDTSAVKINPGGGFSINLPTAVTATTEGSGGFKFGNSSVSTGSSSTNSAKPSSGFMFGQQSDSSKNSTSGFQFGSVSKAEDSKTETTGNLSGGFKFGGSSVDSSSSQSKPGGFVFGTVASSASQPVSKENNAISSSGFQFGAAAVTTAQSSSQNTSNVSESSKSNTSTAFQFGNVPKPEETKTAVNFDFKPNTSNKLPEQTFNFGAPPSSVSTSIATSSTPSFALSTNTTMTSISQTSNKPAVPGLFNFGSGASTGSSNTNGGLGMGKSLSDTPVVNGGFGSNLDSQSLKSSTTDKTGLNSNSGFGSLSGTTPAPVFGFGQSSQPNPTTAPVSVKRSVDFKGTDHSPAKKMGNGQPMTNGLFSFGANNSSSFGAAPSAPVNNGPTPAATNTFGGFGAPAPAQPAPSGGFAFGATSGFGQAPSTQPTAPPPAFGSSAAPAPAGGFSFNMTTPTPNFQFGASSQQAPSQGSPFQFGGNPASSPAPASAPKAAPGLFQFNSASTEAPAFGGAPAAGGMGNFSIGSSSNKARPVKRAVRKLKR